MKAARLAVCALALLAPAATADTGLARDLLAKGRLLAAYDEYLESAQKGDAEAQRMLGMLLERGAKVERGGAELPADPKEAARWYAKAAAQGERRAAAYLGALYAIGLGVKHDAAAAMAHYRKAGMRDQVLRPAVSAKLGEGQRDCAAWVIAVRLYTQREIDYPAEARRGEGVQGEVQMRVVANDRRIERTRNTAGERLGEEAMRATHRAMLLAPAPPGALRIECKGEFALDFRLAD